MAGLSSIRGRGPGGPLVESVRESPELRATVSPQTIYSYDEKRADYVERPGYGRGKWESLAIALGGLNPELKRMLAINNQRWSEEETAMGRELMHRNKIAWNDFIKANPDYAGLNPHLERGYKSADLESKAQDYQAALQNFYTTGGLANETDPEKVRTALDTFGKDYITNNIRRDDFDPDLYNEHFLSPAQAAEGSILARHTGDRAKEHLNLALDKYSQLFANTIDSMLDGTANISNPDVFGGVMDNLSSHATALMQEMEMNGVPRSIANAAIEDAILNLAQAEGEDGHGHEILALADKITTGTGTIGGRPEFKAKAAGLQKQWENERRQRQAEYIQMYHFNKERARDNAEASIGKVLMDAYKSGEPILDATALMSLPGIGPEHLDIVTAVRNNYQSLITFRPVTDQRSQVDLAEDRLRARTGKMSPQEATALAARYGIDDASSLTDIAYTAMSGKDPVSNALQSHGVNSALDMLQTQIAAFGADEDTFKARLVESKELLLDKVAVYVQEGERAGKSRTAEEIRVYAREQAAALGREAVSRDFGVRRDVQTPIEKYQMQDVSYWEANDKQYFSNSETAQNTLSAYVRKREETTSNIQTMYGIPPQMVEPFIVNQARIFNIDLKSLTTAHETEVRRANQKPVQFNRGAIEFGI